MMGVKSGGGPPPIVSAIRWYDNQSGIIQSLFRQQSDMCLASFRYLSGIMQGLPRSIKDASKSIMEDKILAKSKI